MAIWVKCAACGKRYQAADHMAGRRVRCKHCGTTFQLPVAPTNPEPFQQSADAEGVVATAPHRSILDGDDASSAYVEVAPHLPPVNDVDRPTPEIAPPFGDEPLNALAAAEPDVDQVFEDAFTEYRAVRAMTPFVFPGSRFLDRWLPTILAGLCVTWLAYMCLGSGTDEPQWVGPVRLLIILLTYTAVVFPVCLAGVRKAARRLSYELPSHLPWRTFSTFLLPVTIGCVLWLSSGRMGGFVFGAVAGLVVALPAMWFLFRIRTDDAAVSMQYAAGSYAVGVLASVVLLVLLNVLVLLAMRGAKAEHALAMSPFGPGFAWDGPTGKLPPTTPPAKLAVLPERGDPVTPTTMAFTEPSPVGQGPAEAEPAGPTSPSTPVVSLPPGSVEAVTPVVPSPAPVPTPPVQPLPTPPPTTPAEVSAAEAKQATPEARPQTEITAGGKRIDGPTYGSVVGEVTQRLSGEMGAVVHPALPGDAVAVVRKGRRANEDRVELWGTRDWKLKNAVTFARPAEGAATAAGAYHLSADGALLARLADFPYFSAQAYSFGQNVLLRPFIKLDAAGPPPQLGGFISPDQILILYESGARSSAEIWDVHRVKRVRSIPIGGLRGGPGSFAVSRDGKSLGVIVRDAGAVANAPGRLEVYDLLTGKLTRRIVIDQLQWNPAVKPSGVSFTAEADQVAVLFEHEGQGMFLRWGESSELPLQTHVYPGGLLPEGVNTAKFRGQPFALVNDGRAFLLYGASVFDTETGKLLGDLGIKDVRSQKVAGADTILLVQQPEGATKSTLLEVRLDVERARRELVSKR